MPGFNKQGPDGAGAMSGRQQGMCQRTDDQFFRGDSRGRGRGASMRCGFGQGPGQGLGQGLGQSRRFDTNSEPPQSKENKASQELGNLKEQYQAAKNALNIIEEKIAAIESGK